MPKLSKRLIKLHQQAEKLLEKPNLSHDDKEFIFENWNEGFGRDIQRSGSFFTPMDLAYDFALGVEHAESITILDLCAGIGGLSYAHLVRNPKCKITCLESNPAFIEIGKKLVPQARWVQGSVTDLDLLKTLGHFDMVISNPPFGNVLSIDKVPDMTYTGKNAEYTVIALASMMAEYGKFILPMGSCPFRYSGVTNHQEWDNAKYKKFSDATGLVLACGGLDTTCYSSFKNTSFGVEFAECEYYSLKPSIFKPKRSKVAPCADEVQMHLFAT